MDLPAGRPVVGGEEDERPAAQAEFLDMGHEFADLFVEIGHVVGVEVAALLGVGRPHDGAVHQRRRVVEEERLVLVPVDEVECEPMADVGVVHLAFALHGLPVPDVVVFPVPSARRRVGDRLVEPPVERRTAHLPPFPRVAGGVTGLPQDSGEGRFGGSLRVAGGLVRHPAGAEPVAAGGQQAARRPAQRGGVHVVEAQPGSGQLVDVGGLEGVGAVAAHAVKPVVVGEDENDVRAGGRGGCRRRGGFRGRTRSGGGHQGADQNASVSHGRGGEGVIGDAATSRGDGSHGTRFC